MLPNGLRALEAQKPASPTAIRNLERELATIRARMTALQVVERNKGATMGDALRAMEATPFVPFDDLPPEELAAEPTETMIGRVTELRARIEEEMDELNDITGCLLC